MFEIKNVSKQYKEAYALKNISMNIGKGLNFIIGSSGSGKTTLLKIISGMEQEFEGEVLYCGTSVKTFSEQEKSDYYNNIFGFVWQDFNLLEDLTVMENVMLPQYLKPGQDKKAAMQVLRELKISELAGQKVRKLSGGQKQRTAIARELMKNPRVLIADEPTSALDKKSAKDVMEILRRISKNRMVIVVTHDISLIDNKSGVYELDKGELVTAPDMLPQKAENEKSRGLCRLSFRNACKLSMCGIKRKVGRSLTTVFSSAIAATLLLVAVSGAITDSGRSAFDQLYETYGKSILDISVVGSFSSAGGTDGSESDQPAADVDQNIDGLYDVYRKDDRISYIVFTQAYNDIQVTIDGKDYRIQSSGSVPTLNELTAGTMPMGDHNQIVIPESFLKTLGIQADEALGKTVDFKGSIYNWDSGEPVSMPVEITAEIVGVADNTVKYDIDGQVMEYSVDDAFFFSQSALQDMRTQAGITSGEGNFTIRAKTPADMIGIKDELNAQGIVPLGRFELVEDLVHLNQQTAQQSGTAIAVIALLAVGAAAAIAVLTALMRRREYAIFKLSGYAPRHFLLMAVSEFLLLSAGSAMVLLGTLPLTNIGAAAFGDVDILNGKLAVTGVLLVLGMGVLNGVVSCVMSVTTKAAAVMKKGGRSL